MKELYADIIISNNHRSLDRTFQYIVPAHLAENVKEGSLVLIPFRNSLKFGYVLELSSQKQHPKLRKIRSVLCPSLSLNEEEVELAKWLSDYYLTTKARALKLFIPSGALPILTKKIKIIKGNTAGLTVMAKDFYNLIGPSDEWIDFKTFTNEYKNYKKAYQELIKQELLIEDYFVHHIERRTDWSSLRAVLNYDNLPSRSEIKKLKIRAPRQWNIVNALQRGFDLSVQELVKYTNTSLEVVKRLEEKDILLIKDSSDIVEQHSKKAIKLNHEQVTAAKAVINDILKKKYKPYLLYGVTGSGKTEVYMEIMDYCLQHDLQCILMVPEIFLTMQILKRLQVRFPKEIVILHSQLTPKERYEAWRAIKRNEKKIIVGARSAVFAPVNKLGAIILDEEHDTSYKQENDPKYNAKEVAIKRGLWHQCPVVFGSATPSLETFLATQNGKIELLTLSKRVNNYQLPTIEIIDMKNELRQGNISCFSSRLREEIKNTLDNKKQIILYLNRRGFASFILCHDCGCIIKCINCDVSLTYHQINQKLLCHYCNFSQNVPKKCPQCNSIHWKPYGFGTQKIEQEFKNLFPDVSVVRMDSDISQKKDIVQKYLKDFAQGNINVLIGTQMIAKGLDFPNVTLVGVLAADATLNLPDFRSREKSFQLITQVAGRAGRGQWPGKVIAQTFNPADISIRYAKNQDYYGFYKEEIAFREEYNYPPFSHVIRIVFLGAEENEVSKGANEFSALLLNLIKKNIDIHLLQVLGPSPCGLVRIKGEYRYQLLIKYDKHINLRPIIKYCIDNFYQQNPLAPKLNINIDINPNNFV